MNRINTLFQTKKTNLLSIYFMAGYPHLEDTLPTLRALERHCVDLVEIGIPFSDPMADGPVIQSAATQALRNGMTLRRLFAQLEEMRRDVRMPVILMGYLNPIMQYGFEEFCARCAEVGVDGVIIPDLPFADYLGSYKPIAERFGMKVIMLITPETSESRIREIDAHTSGFIYMVSSAAITGAQKSFEGRMAYFQRIDRLNLRNPRLVGFGVSNKATLEAATRYSSGAIVGSKFVQLLGESTSPDEAIERLLKALGE